MMPEVNLALEKGKDTLLDSSCCVARIDGGPIWGLERRLKVAWLNTLTFVKASSFFPSTSPDGLPVRGHSYNSGCERVPPRPVLLEDGSRLPNQSQKSLTHQLPWFFEKGDFLLSPEAYVRTLPTEKLQENSGKSDKSAGLPSTSIRQMVKRIGVDPSSDPGLPSKANSLSSEELNLRLRKRDLANLGRNSRQEDAKIKQLSAERQQTKS
jgi:hypothetical protein